MLSTASYISNEFQEFLNSTIFHVQNWKWIVLILSIIFIFVLNKTLRFILVHFKNSWLELQKTENEETNFISFFIEQKIEKGLSWIISSTLGMILIENLDLPTNLEKYFLILLKLIVGLHLIRLAYFAADASGLLINNWAKTTKANIGEQISPLATKTLKVFVIITGSLIMLQNFGVNVTALLAGLGLGGVAIAFAAQDTVANVFGTITILLDSPFKIGDRIKILDVDGVVEEVGFRSTRIRTLSNSLVTLSNSLVAKEKIENINARNGQVRFRHVFGFTYDTHNESIEHFCSEVKTILQNNTLVMHDRTFVFLSEYAESSINVTINFHFICENPLLEIPISHEFLIQFTNLAKKRNLDFAFPTRTIHLNQKLV